MTPDALPHRGAAAPFAVGLLLAASACVMLWGASSLSVSSASEYVRNAMGERPMTLEDRVVALTAELAMVKAQTARLRANQSDTSTELSHLRAGLANAEIGLDALRTATDDNEARRRDAAAQIEQNLAQLKDETLHLRTAQDDTGAELGSLRLRVVSSEIGIGSLNASTGEIRKQVGRIEAAQDATSSIGTRHKHHRKWVAQR
jgi:septal ring factor EnvC (AmiA/AmiB activator)